MEIGADWFYERMKLVKKFAKEVNIPEVAVCLPLEYKTAVLAFELSKYTDVTVARLDDYSTKRGAVEWLRERGIGVVRKRDAVGSEYFLDCAAVLSRVAVKAGKSFVKVVELTKTGEEHLRKLNARIRAISVDSSTLKGVGENTYGTAFGLLETLLRLNVYLPGKRAAVVGFGRVGSGCARLLRSVGCSVSVVEVSASRKIEAIYEGFEIGDFGEADIVVTCTGVAGVLGFDELSKLKTGAVVLNLGAEFEIDLSRCELIADYGAVKKYRAGETEFYVVADGYAANLAVGNGTPIEVMDRTFSAAILALNHLKEDFEGIAPLPPEIETRVLSALCCDEGAVNYLS